ncbi:MAG: hypothetical protein NXI31_05685 [bacterium]|nr:hypothetical protein [bacterium]
MVTARAAALHALTALQKGQQQRVREALDGARLRGRDQAFAYELVHGVLRRERLLDHVLAGLAHRGLPSAPSPLSALRLGAYQILFADGVPSHAAVDETVGLVRQQKGFINAILRRVTACVRERDRNAQLDEVRELALSGDRALELPAPLPADFAERIAIVHSLPTFLVQRWLHAHDESAVRDIAAATVAVPRLWLRPIGPGSDEDVAELAQHLERDGVQTRAVGAEGRRSLQWMGGESPFAATAFAAGRFVVQDPTAAAAARAVPCNPGDTVIDLCAAPGTKTALLAARVRPGGKVFAFDVDEVRRGRILENVARLQLEDVVEVVTDRATLRPASAVLADVPCSNTGVLGRRVEVRRRLDEAAIERLAAVQRGLLADALDLVEPGGHAIYSTCSIEPEENAAVVAAVLADRPGCEVVDEQLTLPRAGECDGGFHAVIRRA